MAPSTAHIAGVGITSLESSGGASKATLHELAISAGTKALLDAGVTYSDVDQGVACFLDESLRIPRSCFNTFGMMGTPVAEVDNHSGLSTAIHSIRSGQSNCAMVIGFDKESSNNGGKAQALAIAMVLVSKTFLTSHAYLKDAAACIRGFSLANGFYSRSSGGANESRTTKTAVQAALRQAQLEPRDIQIVEVRSGSNSNVRQSLSGFRVTEQRESSKSLESFTGTTGLAGLCGLVWLLRGWGNSAPVSQVKNCLQYTADLSGAASAIIISRSDERTAQAWEDIKNLRDGRERLGYNPAVEMREISREDLEDVRAREEFTSDDAVKQLQLTVRGGDRAALARL